MIWDELQKDHGFNFLLTRRLTLDCIENLFSIIRKKGGNNVTPNCTKFRLSLRLIMANQLLEPSTDGNCEEDSSSFLLLMEDMKTKSKIITVTIELKHVSENELACDLTDQDLIQDDAASYVSGWACNKLPHDECKKLFALPISRDP